MNLSVLSTAESASNAIFQAMQHPESSVTADYCLIVRGDSMMNARLNDGDIVFIRSQQYIENGEIAAVIIDEDVYLRRVYFYGNDLLILKAENPKYEDLIYSGDQTEELFFIGKAVAFQGSIV